MRHAHRAILTGWRALGDAWILARCRRWLVGHADVAALRLVRHIFNAAVVTDGRHFFKIGCRGPNSVRSEYAAAEALERRHPDLAPYLPRRHLFALIGGRPCICSERLAPVPRHAAAPLASSVLSAFWQAGASSPQAGCAAWPTPQARMGFELAKSMLGPAASSIEHSSVPAFRWGPAHGDFHLGNLMQDDRGHPKIIDLDCVRLEAPQEFDWIYFNVEWEVARNGCSWLQAVGAHAKQRTEDVIGAGDRGIVHRDPAALLCFMLDRLGQEAKYGIRPDSAQLAECVKTLLSALSPPLAP